MVKLGLDVTPFADTAARLGDEGKSRFMPPSTASWLR
jgi:hypothetical protein